MNTLAMAIAAALQVEIHAIHPLSAREGRLVARVETSAGTVLAKVDAAPRAFNREEAAMSRLRALGLPVADVLVLEPGPPALLVASWTEGRPVRPDDPARTLARVGEILRAVHAQQAGPPFSGHGSIREWIEGWLRSLLPWWIATGQAPAGAETWCESWLAGCRPLLDRRPGRLILFDGRPDHFLVDARGDVAMIDVADLMSGDPAMDLAVFHLESPAFLPSILAGYRPDDEEREALRRLVPLYAFLRALAGAEWQERFGDRALASRLLTGARERLVAYQTGRSEAP